MGGHAFWRANLLEGTLMGGQFMGGQFIGRQERATLDQINFVQDIDVRI